MLNSKAFEEPVAKAQIRLRTLYNLYQIRRAYGAPIITAPKRAALISFLVLFLLFGAVFTSRIVDKSASSATASVAGRAVSLVERKVPAVAPSSLPFESIPYAFLVDKTRKSLSVYKAAGDQWLKQEDFSIVVGESPGRKQSEGDKRTPEGLYWIIGERSSLELDTAIYGNRAYVLNYPNRFDRREGRGGSGIWIHGTNRPVSRGCVAINKADLERVATYARVGIPVYIASEVGQYDFGHYVPAEILLAERDSAMFSDERLRESACEFVRKWSQVWQSADIGEYRKFYSPDLFESKGLGYEDYMRYKEELFRSAVDSLHVQVRNMVAEERDSSRINVRFQQLYRAGSQFSSSTKMLELIRSPEGLRIVGERVVTNL